MYSNQGISYWIGAYNHIGYILTNGPRISDKHYVSILGASNSNRSTKTLISKYS